MKLRPIGKKLTDKQLTQLVHLSDLVDQGSFPLTEFTRIAHAILISHGLPKDNLNQYHWDYETGELFIEEDDTGRRVPKKKANFLKNIFSPSCDDENGIIAV